MATCDLPTLIAQACENKFTCVTDERTRRAVKLQFLCNLSPPPIPPPDPCENVSPTNLAVFILGDTTITVTWQVAAGATGTDVFWSTTPGVTMDNAEGVSCVGQSIEGAQQCDLTSLTPDTTYYIAASDSSNPACISNEIIATTTL